MYIGQLTQEVTALTALWYAKYINNYVDKRNQGPLCSAYLTIKFLHFLYFSYYLNSFPVLTYCDSEYDIHYNLQLLKIIYDNNRVCDSHHVLSQLTSLSLKVDT